MVDTRAPPNAEPKGLAILSTRKVGNPSAFMLADQAKQMHNLDRFLPNDGFIKGPIICKIPFPNVFQP